MIDPGDSKTIGHHLFLEPSGALKERLDSSIEALAKEYGGPVFNSHVTLLARITGLPAEEIAERTRTLASTLKPFTIELGEFGMEDTYFRALYLKVVQNDDLQEAHRSANEVFSMADEGEYVPHLSLLYGNYPRAQKEETARQLSAPHGARFVVDRIALYETEGEATGWVKLQEFELGA